MAGEPRAPEGRGTRPEEAGVPATVTAAGTVLAVLLAPSVRFVPVGKIVSKNCLRDEF